MVRTASFSSTVFCRPPTFQYTDFTVYCNPEDIPVVEIEDSDCKTMTERTVFDHLREKSKNLPTLPISNDTCSPSLETFTLIRKRTREKHLELDSGTEFQDEKEGSKIPRGNVIIPYPELTEVEQNRQFLDKDSSPDGHNSSIASYLMSDTGESKTVSMILFFLVCCMFSL